MKKVSIQLFTVFSLLFFTGCGGGSNNKPDSTQSQQDAKAKALTIISNYAEDTNAPAPTIEDYKNAGVSGLENIDIDTLNTEISHLSAEDVDTTEKINAIIVRLGISIKPIANTQSINTNEDTSKPIRLTGSDIAGNTLTYIIVSNPKHGTLSGTAPHLIYTPEQNYYGNDSFTFKVNNTKEDSAETAVKITIAPINDAPIVDTGRDKSTQVNTALTLIGIGSDIEGEVTYQWKEGNTILSNSATFSYTPTTIGIHNLTLTVTDSNGVITTDAIKIHVSNDTSNNTPPVAPSGISGWSETQEGARIGWVDNSNNEDGFRIYDSKNHVIADTIPENTIAHTLTGLECNTLYSVRVTAYNGDGESDKSNTKTFRTKACNNNTKPNADAGRDQSTKVNQMITLKGLGSDAEGDVTYQWTEGNTILSNSATFNYTPETIGDHTLTLTVTDEKGLSATNDMVVHVTEAEGPAPAAPSWRNSIWGQTQTSASISWIDNADNEIGFRIYNEAGNILENNIPAKDGAGEATSHSVGGLTCGVTNNVTVVAYNDNGESEKSKEYNIKTKLCPNILPKATVSASPTKVELGKEITFTCEGSDEDGSIESYRWLKGSTEVATTATFTTKDFSVGENTYKCQVKDDRKDTAIATVTIIATSDEPTAYATVSSSSIIEEERATMNCLGNETYEGGIKAFKWFKNGTVVYTGQTYKTPTDLTEGDYTYTCEVKYNDNVTANDNVKLSVKKMDANLESINLSQDFEEFEVGEYDPTKKSSPAYYANSEIAHHIELDFFGIINRSDGKGKALCIKGKASKNHWTDIFAFNIPDLNNTHRINLAGTPTINFEFKETNRTKYHGVTWLNLYNRIEYRQGSAPSVTSGGTLFPNVDPGTWQKSDIANFRFTFGIDNPEFAGTFYDIKTKDTSMELTALALKISEANSKDVEETIDFCIDNIHLGGTQMKPAIFDEEYGKGGNYKRWNDYTRRVGDSKFADIQAAITEISNKSVTCNNGLSSKQDYQCHKLKALKRHIDYIMTKMRDTKSSNGGAFFKEDVQRIEEAIARYNATYTMFNAPPPANDFTTYRVPAMKYGRLDGYTFPMEYSTTEDKPYNLSMAKDEYRSIAILLDPGQGYDEELTFTNTTFSEGGGVTIDKYIAPVWYQSGKNNSTFDDKVFRGEYGPPKNLKTYPEYEGGAWLTQELLLKNAKLIKIERDPNEKNLIFYKGKNLIYTTGKSEVLKDDEGNDWGKVPGYVQISSKYNSTDFTPYDIKGIKDGKTVRVNTRYNLPSNDPELLAFDDSKTIQPFNLKDEYVLLWGIIHIDKDASDGQHTAYIEIKKGNTTVKQIPININVLGYKLSESKLDYGLYYHGTFEGDVSPHSLWGKPAAVNKVPKQVQLDLKDMFEHGIRYPIVQQGNVGSRVTTLLEYLAAAHFPGDKFFSWYSETFARSVSNPEKIKELQNMMESHDHFKNAQLYLGIPDEASISELADVKRFIRDVVRSDYWKSRLNVKTWGGVFKDAVSVLANGGYLDAPIINSSQAWLTRYQLEQFPKAENDVNGNPTDGATTYKYGDPQSGVENPEVYRRNFGITMYQEGYTGGGMDYAYQKQYGFYWNDFDLAYTFEKNHREEAFTYPTTGLVEGGKGFVSTIQWEGYRAAITDMRYLSTLLDKRDDANKKGMDTFIKGLDTSKGSDLDAIREKIIEKIENPTFQ